MVRGLEKRGTGVRVSWVEKKKMPAVTVLVLYSQYRYILGSDLRGRSVFSSQEGVVDRYRLDY